MSDKVGRGKLLNRQETAETFGIATSTLSEWVRRGCPVVQRGSRGKPWTFNTAEVARWRDGDVRADATSGIKDATTAELQRRKLAAETEAAELELARSKAEVVPVDEIERGIRKAFAELRTGFRNVLPGRAARRLLGETDETRLKAVLLEETDQVLEALADTDLVAAEDIVDEDG